ncbi:MAG TPA: arginine deiminase-related protein [Gammaproteobacteria bacterium]
MTGTRVLADTVALVRATHFNANAETLASNAFQLAAGEPGAAAAALREQVALAGALETAGVNVIWLDPPESSRSPDGVFPNNWFSTHEDGRLVLYPMQAPSRRGEQLPDLADRLHEHGFHVAATLDLSPHASDGRFLEGTGSLVLDRGNRIAYACRSVRTDIGLAKEWAARLGYRIHEFTAQDPAGRAIYHSNVMMSIGAGIAIACFDAIPERVERERLRHELIESGNDVLEIDWAQVKAFAGNQLFLDGRKGPVVALSATADASLRADQVALLERHAARCVADVATIERHGGGSVRCMLAEIFLPREGQVTTTRSDS